LKVKTDQRNSIFGLAIPLTTHTWPNTVGPYLGHI